MKILKQLMTIVINFDGSFYPAVNLLSTATITPNHKRKAHNSKKHYPRAGISSCSACIFSLCESRSKLESDEDLAQLVSLGAKCLSRKKYNEVISTAMSSSSVEYDGLLFGLKMLLEVIEKDVLDLSINSPTDLIVRGDCKTVLQQADGSSIPRILVDQHARLIELEHRIMSTGFIKAISYEMIPRHENKLADHLARKVSKITQLAIYESLHNDIIDHRLSIHQVFKCFGDTDVNTSLHPILLFDLLSSLAQRCCEDINDADNSVEIDQSIRLNLSSTLNQIGSYLRALSHCFPSSRPFRLSMNTQGILYEIEALKYSGKHREAYVMEKRYRYQICKASTIKIILDKEIDTVQQDLKKKLPLPCTQVHNSYVLLYQKWFEKAQKSIRNNTIVTKGINYKESITIFCD